MAHDEQEWRVIPDFPKYEITFDGEIRTVDQKADISLRQSGEESDLTVSLYREGGVVEKEVNSLILNAFPEFRQVSDKARLDLIKRFASEMQHWLGGELFAYAEFEQLADIVIDEGWRPYE